MPSTSTHTFPTIAPKDNNLSSPSIKLRIVKDQSKKAAAAATSSSTSTDVNNLCTNCSSTKSPLWRRGQHGEVLCNACGLYWSHHGSYRPLPGKAPTDNNSTSTTGAIIAATTTTTTTKKRVTKKHKQCSLKENPPKRTILLPIDHNIENMVQPNISKTKYIDLPRQPRLRPALAPKPLNFSSQSHSRDDEEVKFIMNGFRMLFPGDHVAIRGADSLIYFAILADFCIDLHTKEKMCKLVWLLPKTEYSNCICFDCDKLTPEMFTIGSTHEQWESMEAIVDVFYSPYSSGVLSARSLKSGNFLSELGAAHFLCDLQ